MWKKVRSSLDEQEDLLRAQHLVQARPLHVQDLATQGQDRLEGAVAALLRGAAGGIALDQEEFGLLRVLLLAIGQLAGQVAAVERGLATREVAGLAGGLAGAGGLEGLAHDDLRDLRMLFEVGGEAVVDEGLDEALDLGVAQLGLGLALELRLQELDRDEADESFADVVAGDRDLRVLEQLVLLGVGVDRAGQGRAEADEMRAAFDRVDRVGEGEHVLAVAVVPLQRDLAVEAVARAVHVDRLVVQRLLLLVEMLDELVDAALVLVFGRVAGAAVLERDAHPAVQEGELPKALGERVEVEFLGLAEDLRVRPELDQGAAVFGGALVGEGHRGRAHVVFLNVRAAALVDLEAQLGRERVHDRHADAVQAARHLVGFIAELAARVERGQHDFGRRLVLGLVHADRDAAPVVEDGDRVVFVDDDSDVAGVTGLGLVDGVVDDLVDEMVQALDRGRADVHRRALAHRLEAFEDLDAPGVVGGVDDLNG
jgi:hypothetical protein